MRCIRHVVLLLCGYAATTTSSASTSDNDNTASDIAGSSATELIGTTPTTTTVTTSKPNLNSSTSTTKTTQDGPLVFLPQTSPTTCPSRTINYITHSLPQQCLRTSRSAPANGTSIEEAGGSGTAVVDGTTVLQDAVTTDASADEASEASAATGIQKGSAGQHSIVVTESSRTATVEDTPKLGLEDEHDSPLDNSKFLSFEEWKKQNLAKVGQSPEDVKQGRPQGGEGRRRPINNALDTLGEEGEIELDFTGFGDSSSRYTLDAATAATPAADTTGGAEESAHASPARHRSKDAGKTCKERFNYASFDCAATVLKTNQKCKSSSSVLVENKDSYMLNECSTQNKFIIIELCDDILVDTVVVANFEFFSSMFRTFRISVSDRYPVKLDRWKDLGTFEARNTRDIQAFLVENPLIWARYVRIEFLTQYGSEFYCPVSLVRVHGTTMMEEFRHQEDATRGDDEELEELVPEVEIQEPVPVEVVSSALPVISTPSETVAEKTSDPATNTSNETADAASATTEAARNATMIQSGMPVAASNSTDEARVALSSLPAKSESQSSEALSTATAEAVELESQAIRSTPTTASSTTEGLQTEPEEFHSQTSGSSLTPSDANAPSNTSIVRSTTRSTTSLGATAVTSKNSTTSVADKPSDNTTTPTVQASEGKSSSVSAAGSRSSKSPGTESIKQPPPPPQPSTQDSFFKATNKRLTMLETNSSLNIQYIEEQSRILRDAFVQTEKHQLKKTENFLKHLNDTVMAELKGFRTQYDQLWQSTVIELEESRARSEKEMMAFSTRLTMLADELVWAKRMNVVHSVLLLAVLGLFVFASKGKEYMDMPIMQSALKRSQSVLRLGRSGSFDSPSPPGSPESTRASSPEFRRSLRKLTRLASSDVETRPTSQGSDVVIPLMERGIRPNDLSPATPHGKISNPGLHFEPPTPDASIDGRSDAYRSPSPTLTKEEVAKAIARQAHSGPATPSGTRESLPPDWDGTADDDIDSPSASTTAIDALSSSRMRNKLLPSVDRRPSPLRFSESHEIHVNGEEVLPSVEGGDDAASFTDIDSDAGNKDYHHARPNTGRGHIRKDSHDGDTIEGDTTAARNDTRGNKEEHG
jgi:hypothetical protein